MFADRDRSPGDTGIGNGPSRRGFLSRCAGCALAAGCAGAAAPARIARAAAAAPEGRPKVKVVFTHSPPGVPSWPHSEYDYESRKRAVLAGLEMAVPDVQFVPVTVMKGDDVKPLLDGAAANDADGYLCYMVGIWTGAPQAIAMTGKPTLFVDDLYGGSGEFLVALSAARRHGWNVAGVSSTRFDDVTAAAKHFAGVKDPAAAKAFGATVAAAARARYGQPGDLSVGPIDAPPNCDPAAAVARMKDSTILLVGSPMHAIGTAITEAFGTRVVPLDFAALDAAYKAADADESKAVATGWTRRAESVVEPSADELLRSAAMYLGMKALMAQHGAQAITINCLGGFYGGHMAAYPCLGFCEFNDAGLVGACEADLRSTLTMLLTTYLTGRPGYISDPVIDTSRNQIIYAHCVAPSKVDGPEGPANPVVIRSHSEDRHGASLRSLLPLGRMTTSLEIEPTRKEILFHQAKAVANIDEDKACRTKLAAEVKGDIDKLMTRWDQWGWHRVTFYGDLREPVTALADRIGYRLVEEA
jgi:hypothetical protein